MQDLNERIGDALEKEEARAERFANTVRFILLGILTIVALLNVFSVSYEATLMNFGVLAVVFAYGLIVAFFIRNSGYHPRMKYITSSLDILVLILLLFLYTRIEVPSVALKNYVFLVVFPLIALTAFRYDRLLTLVSGGLAVLLYTALIIYLASTHQITITHGGYERELFTGDITYIGQGTKLLLLVGFVLLISYLAQYSQRLITKLVSEELSTRTQKELTDWELNVASDVQRQFLPHAYPVIPGLEIFGDVRQGRFVGGDYYDFVALDNGRLLVIAADVSGNGVPAALIMAEVRASIHLLAPMKIELEDSLQRLNSLLYRSTDKKSFVTFFAAEVDTVRRQIMYVNAGHPPPLIYSGGEVRSLAKGTLPLGVSSALPRLATHTEAFHPRSVLLAYTDGLLEQTNSDEEQFGEERIREYLRSNAHLDAGMFIRKLLEMTRSFGGGKDLNDDIGLAVVKFLPT